MSAVRQIDVFLVLPGHAEQFGQQGTGRRLGTIMVERDVTGWPGIAEPPPEPDIEQRHKKRNGSRRVIALVRTRRGPRNGHGGAKRDFAAVLFALAEAGNCAAAMERRDDEGGGLALLPG